jgi:probable phosphoglycerate mutase
MTALAILRHGETTWNREGRLQGGLDSALTSLGRLQAARQGAILREAGLLDRPAFCSPQPRARITAALAGLRPTVEPRLREVALGAWEGRTLSEIAAPSGLAWKFDAPGGEGLPAFEARLRSVLAALPPRAIVVTHGVVAIGLRGLLLGIAPARWDRLTDPQGVVYDLALGHETIRH